MLEKATEFFWQHFNRGLIESIIVISHILNKFIHCIIIETTYCIETAYLGLTASSCKVSYISWVRVFPLCHQFIPLQNYLKTQWYQKSLYFGFKKKNPCPTSFIHILWLAWNIKSCLSLIV